MDFSFSLKHLKVPTEMVDKVRWKGYRYRIMMIQNEKSKKRNIEAKTKCVNMDCKSNKNEWWKPFYEMSFFMYTHIRYEYSHIHMYVHTHAYMDYIHTCMYIQHVYIHGHLSTCVCACVCV